jgi:hypothetical protein
MNESQIKKVREIMQKVEAVPHKHEVGGWVEKDHVYLFVKPEKVELGPKNARLYTIDRNGRVAVHRNYAPLQLRNNTLIMGCRG